MEELIGRGQAFAVGVAGAFVVYIAMYRNTRIAASLSNIQKHWSLLIVDIVLFMAAGGFVAAFGIYSGKIQGAFTAGATWQGIIGGLFSGIEVDGLRKQLNDRGVQLAKAHGDIQGLLAGNNNTDTGGQ